MHHVGTVETHPSRGGERCADVRGSSARTCGGDSSTSALAVVVLSAEGRSEERGKGVSVLGTRSALLEVKTLYIATVVATGRL